MVERDRVEGLVPFFGQYNFLNVLCSLAVARALEVDINQAVKALESYPVSKRRSNLLFSDEKLKLFDDYAHNPGKIDAVIDAIKDTFPRSQIHVVFQPHRYSRMTTMYDEFANLSPKLIRFW